MGKGKNEEGVIKSLLTFFASHPFLTFSFTQLKKGKIWFVFIALIALISVVVVGQTVHAGSNFWI